MTNAGMARICHSLLSCYNSAMNKSLIGRKLFLTLFLLGILNILMAYAFFYYSSISLLEERSGQQMASVRALASEKMKLYLENLKTFAVQNSGRPYKNKSEDSPEYKNLVPLTFYPSGSDEIVIKVPDGKKFVIWNFPVDGFNRLLDAKEGLGKTGEIYLVGLDHKIRSASRHVKDWKNIKVENESIRLGGLEQFGVHTVIDYRGVEVVSAFSPFHYDELRFILLSEIDKEEVLLPLRSLFPKIFVLCGVLFFLTLILAYFSTFKILTLIENMRKQINNFHVKFINAMEEEKRKISYNLHDGLGQILTAIKWGISQNTQPEKLKELCDEAFKEIRSLSNNLMPVILTELGFFPAVKEHLARIESYYKIKSTYRFSEQLAKLRFQEGMDVNLYRMIQEFLHNTVKHAEAGSVSLVLLKEDNFLQLRYEDDGVGMPDTNPMPRVLLYRSELMGAEIKRSKTPEGLVYLVQIPLKRLFHDNV